MRVPLSWLLEYAPVGPAVDAAEVARRLTAAGLEVESVEQVGHEAGGMVGGEGTGIEELTGFRKPVRYCRVVTGTAEARGSGEARGPGEYSVICGAVNFIVGDRVPLALPGSVLPGGVETATRQPYARTPAGIISSAAHPPTETDHSQ